MPSHNLDIDERDLSEAPRLAKDSQSKGTLVALIAASLLLLALLVYGSLPELSPEEIVAMDGYEGEQPTKHIFNIHSLEEKAKAPTTASGAVTEAQTTATVATTQASTPVAQSADAQVQNPQAVAETSVAAETVAVVEQPVQPAAVEVTPATVEESVAPVENTDQPASTVVTTIAVQDEPTQNQTDADFFSDTDENKVVAAMATTPTIDEAADTVVVSSIAAPVPVPVPVGTAGAASEGEVLSRGKLLPLRSVLQDSTELKASPSSQSKTLLSLGRGVVVTAFERHGKWIHVGTNDGSSITGFVLESSLGRVNTKG